MQFDCRNNLMYHAAFRNFAAKRSNIGRDGILSINRDPDIDIFSQSRPTVPPEGPAADDHIPHFQLIQDL